MTLASQGKSVDVKTHEVDVVVTPWEDGSYLVEVPALQGCWCVLRGRQTVARALEDIREVVEMAMAARENAGKPPAPRRKPGARDGSLRMRLTVPAR